MLSALLSPTFLSVLLVLITAVVLFLKKSMNYWTSKGVLQREHTSLLIGDVNFSKQVGIQFKEHYDYFKSRNVKFGGVYTLLKPVFIPIDINLLKNILVKDFDHFVNHQSGIQVEYDMLSGHLFNLTDEKWRSLRSKLSPTFTSGKMKMMFETFVECTKNLNLLLMEQEALEGPVDIKDVLGRFTTDIIGNCAFGMECNSMQNPDSEFRSYGRKIFAAPGLEKYRRILIQTLPKSIVHFLRMKLVDNEASDFFIHLVKDIVEYREKNNVFRPDFMHLLLQLKNRGALVDDEKIKDDNKTPNNDSFINMDELTAQCFVFFVAGFETSSTAMSFALYELSRHEDIQEKLREEINTVLKKYNDKLTYEAVKEMKYLDRVLHETLRKYPAVPMIPRECNKDYKIPDTNIIIEKGTLLGIPVLGLHMDEHYYPKPEKFDPERFTEENKAKRPHFAYIPFGEGPRICIGLRFGILQSKVGLATFIKNYKVTFNNKTEYPIQLDPAQFISFAKGGVWLDINKI